MRSSPITRSSAITRSAAIAALATWLGGCASTPVAPPPTAPLEVPTAVAEDVPPPAPLTYDAVKEPLVVLADGLRAREPRRALLAYAGHVYWDLASAEAKKVGLRAPDGEPYRLDEEVIVVERHPQHLRVVYEVRDARLAFYVPESEFHEVTKSAVTLLDDGGEPFADGCGVTLPGGTVLELGPTRVGFRRAKLDNERLRAKGVLPPSSLDRVFVAPPPAPEERVHDCTVKSPIVIRDAPRGQVVAELVNDQAWYCKQGVVRGGAQKVTVFGEDATLVGFVPASAVTPVSPGDYFDELGARGLGLWGVSHATFLYLWPGDALYPAEGGAQIGRVNTRAMRAIVEREENDGARVISFPVAPWGFTELSIDRATYEAAATKYDAWLARVTFARLKVTGGATVEAVRAWLEDERDQVTQCFDEALEEQPGVTFRYEVEVDHAVARPAPKLSALGASAVGLEDCLTNRLRGDVQALLGSRSRFTLELTPNSLIDAVTPNPPPATR